MADPIIVANQLRKTFRTGNVTVQALRGVDLTIERGEMVAIMGPSGCGKTTLLNCLSGLDDFDSGEVLIEGTALRVMNDRARTNYRARRMGFVFQTFNLLPVITALENVELPLLVSGVRPGEARRRAGAALAQAGSIYTFDRRAEGYADDAAVWRALRERDDVAVLDRYLVVGGTAEAGAPSAAPSGETNDGTLPRFRLQGLDPNSRAPLPQLELELRPSQNGAGGAVQGEAGGGAVRVIAVYHQAGTLAGGGLHLNIRAARKVTGQAEPHSYYIKTRAGADVKQVAQGLEKALVPYGHNVTPLADTFSQGREVARGILQLVQGFMALGLLVGMAALGVISSRTVVERRQQIGMLRAIGYQPATVAFSFLLESSFIALTGILIGTLVGVLMGRQMIGGLLSFATPGQTVPVPWASIGGVLLLAYLFSLLTTLLPALQASRIYPAEALRYE